jgi:hypothetical protein
VTRPGSELRERSALSAAETCAAPAAEPLRLWYSLFIAMKEELLLLSLAAASIAATGCRREETPASAGAGAASGSSAGAGTGAGTAAAGEVAPESVARGKQAVGALKRELVTALTEALKNGAPAAIAVCSGVAPGLARTLSSSGVTVGRATRKPRNPANAATGWRADALARFEAMVAAGVSLDGVTWTSRLPDGTTAYAEPLVIQPLCLACHGAALGPEVKAELASRYPADQATGYAVGDLRGVAWAEIATRPN